MAKYIVPQFIDIEDKILGPITTRQFLIVVVCGILLFLAYRFSTMNLFILQASAIVLIGGSMAFLRINGMPFHLFLLNFLSSLTRPSLRIWYKETSENFEPKNKANQEQEVFIPRQAVTSKKLSELALIVDTGGIYKGEEEISFIYQTPYGRKKA